jgi:hypothetical protein
MMNFEWIMFVKTQTSATKGSQRDQILLFTPGEERNPGIKGNLLAPVFWQNQTLAME